jgi:L-methionine (R)-S-oxide reductase
MRSGCGKKRVCYTSPMDSAHEKFLAELAKMVSESKDRMASLRDIAKLIRVYGGYRWVGLYDVDHDAGLLRNFVWSGPSAPEYTTFPIHKGLTGAVIAGRQVVNVGDVSADARYLTALGTTRSEIIVPVFDREKRVVGTIDVESERLNAFDRAAEMPLVGCSETTKPLWEI